MNLVFNKSGAVEPHFWIEQCGRVVDSLVSGFRSLDDSQFTLEIVSS